LRLQKEKNAQKQTEMHTGLKSRSYLSKSYLIYLTSTTMLRYAIFFLASLFSLNIQAQSLCQPLAKVIKASPQQFESLRDLPITDDNSTFASRSVLVDRGHVASIMLLSKQSGNYRYRNTVFKSTDQEAARKRYFELGRQIESCTSLPCGPLKEGFGVFSGFQTLLYVPKEGKAPYKGLEIEVVSYEKETANKPTEYSIEIQVTNYQM
jgi:hypothetical protein